MLRIFVLLLVCHASAAAWAQATATPRDTDPNLIFDLLGTVNSFEVAVPDEVLHAFVVAVQGEEVLLESGRNTEGEDVTLHVSAGALAEVTGCTLLLFTNLDFIREDGLSGNRATRCLPPEAEHKVLPGGESPLTTLRDPLDLPLDTWLAIESFALEGSAPSEDPAATRNYVIFYLYLSTDDASEMPALPTYATWQEVQRAFL